MAHRELNQVKEVTYLGVSLSEEGVTDSKDAGENPKRKDRHLPAESAGCFLARAKPY